MQRGSADDRESVSNRQIDRQLLFEEIRMIVSDAITSREILRIGKHANRLQQAYPAGGLSHRGIANEIILAASLAKVPLEIDGETEKCSGLTG